MEAAQMRWYVADLVMEITISGASRNVVHRNLFLLSASSPDEAYQKALQLGTRSEQSYENPQGQRVDHKFRGIAKLDSTVDGTLEDGSELDFVEHLGIPEEQLRRWIGPKESLGAFFKFDPGRRFDPDYRSGEIMRQVAEALGDPNPDTKP
jgi:hypothetical protein